MKIITLPLLLLLSAVCTGQVRSLVSSNGNAITTDNFKYSISIGESISGIISGQNMTLSQGFIPILLQTKPTNINKEELSVNIHPNPFASSINIEGLDLSKEHFISIVSSTGKVVINKQLKSKRIDASHLPSGSYIIIIRNEAFTIQKILIKQ